MSYRLTIFAVGTETDTCLLGLPRSMVDTEKHYWPTLCFDQPLLGQDFFFIGNPGLPLCIKRAMFSCHLLYLVVLLCFLDRVKVTVVRLAPWKRGQIF